LVVCVETKVQVNKNKEEICEMKKCGNGLLFEDSILYTYLPCLLHFYLVVQD